ncbi:MAG TPA: MFS transporter [Nitrospiria bacterium]|nr:MFS transporter [Nitrospiria bacterium]
MKSNHFERRGWYFYDWANSAFSTTVVTVFLGPYLTTLTKSAAGPDGFLDLFGIRLNAGSFFPYVVSLSVLLQVILLPIVGAIADYSHRKKQMLAVFAYLGSLATTGMYFLYGSRYLLGGALFIFANVSFGASVIIYNAFLPEIAGPDERDAVSSMGWAIGYLGGGLLLMMNLVLFSQAGSFGLTTGQAVRISLASAGVWWGIFTIIPLVALKSRQAIKRLPPKESYLMVGFKQLRRTLGKVRAYPQTLLFLAAYLLYNDGIQTVITLSSEFGQEELKLPISTLTTVILMVQFVAFAGAILFNYIAKSIGSKRAIVASLVIWTGSLIYAYGFLRTALHFYALAAVIGVVLGGSQALSRSVYSLMIPKGQEAEYFSLYEVSERGTSWLGPLLFGLSLQLTGSYRIAILSLVVFFILGMVLLLRVDVRKATIEAGNQPPAGI